MEVIFLKFIIFSHHLDLSAWYDLVTWYPLGRIGGTRIFTCSEHRRYALDLLESDLPKQPKQPKLRYESSLTRFALADKLLRYCFDPRATSTDLM